MKEKMMRIIVTVMLTLLLCSLTLLAGAASKNDWKTRGPAPSDNSPFRYG